MTSPSSLIVRLPEAAHWYKADGTPAYTVPDRNGNDRATTLRDARKHGLIPSVTTILKTVYKPALEAWKQEQLLLAALTLPRESGESEKSFIARVMQDSRETASKAAERGTLIHEAIENSYLGQETKYPEICAGFKAKIAEVFGETNLIPEESFGGSYGGKVDLNDPRYLGRGLVIDTKTKEFGPDDKPPVYEDNLMQLAAYRVGLCLPNARCANVLVSATHPGLVRVHEWSQEDLQKGWQMFDHLRKFWALKNNHGA